MRHAIETAPKDGHFVILEDDANAVYDVGRWSAEAGGWIGKDDSPIKITPTHWHPFARDAYLQPQDEAAVVADRAGAPAWRRIFMPIIGIVAAATALVLYLKQDVIAPPASTSGHGQFSRDASTPSSDAKISLAEARQSVASETGSLVDETKGVREQAGAAQPAPRQPSTADRNPPEVQAPQAALAQELVEARRTIERLEAQLRAEATAEQVLQQERERAAVLAEHAAAARQELTASTAQHGRVLDEERARNAALTSELAMARREIETQTAQLRQADSEMALSKQAEATKTGQLLEHHRQIVAALAEAATARQELTTGTAQHIQALEQERARYTAMASELAMARREIETQAAQLRQASSEAMPPKQPEVPKTEPSLEQQRESIAAALAEAAAARQELKASAAQHAQALDEERARNAALASEMAMLRREVETQAAQSQQASAEAAQLKQADGAKTEQLLEQQRQKAAALAEATATRQEGAANAAQHRLALVEERARNASLASDLAAAQQVNEKLATQFRLVGEQTELRRRADEAELAALQQALRDERGRAAAWASELDASRRAAAARIQPETVTGSPAPREIAAAAGTAMAPPVASDMPGGAEAARMIARAGVLIGQGDIGAARIVLERAAELGSARAFFMLAETYDPGVLSAWKTYGTRGEVTKARELYAKAQAGGIREAKERLDNLGR